MPEEQNRAKANTEVSSAPSSFPVWVAPSISGVSALFAGLALFIAIRSNRRSDRVERVNQFDREYGAELRALFRKLDAKLAILDGFTVSSAVSIDRQRDELSVLASELEDLTSQIILILEEIDDDESLRGNEWCTKFRNRCESAEEQIGAAQSVASSQVLLFQRAVGRAQSDYKSGVRVIRRQLRAAGRQKTL